MLATAERLLGKTEVGRRPIRLAGISVSGLAPADLQAGQLVLPFRDAG